MRNKMKQYRTMKSKVSLNKKTNVFGLLEEPEEYLAHQKLSNNQYIRITRMRGEKGSASKSHCKSQRGHGTQGSASRSNGRSRTLEGDGTGGAAASVATFSIKTNPYIAYDTAIYSNELGRDSSSSGCSASEDEVQPGEEQTEEEFEAMFEYESEQYPLARKGVANFDKLEKIQDEEWRKEWVTREAKATWVKLGQILTKHARALEPEMKLEIDLAKYDRNLR